MNKSYCDNQKLTDIWNRKEKSYCWTHRRQTTLDSVKTMFDTDELTMSESVTPLLYTKSDCLSRVEPWMVVADKVNIGLGA